MHISSNYGTNQTEFQVHVMTYKGNFTAVYKVPGNVYAIDYIPDIRAIAAVNISVGESPSKVMLVNADSGMWQRYLLIFTHVHLSFVCM